MHGDECVLILCTVPDRDLGATIARALVDEALAACVNRLPGVVSTYRWQGERVEDAEELLLVKTTAVRFEDVRARIRALHRYDSPEIVALPIATGDHDYLQWLRASVQPR